MIYINDMQIVEKDINWIDVLEVIEKAVFLLYQNDYRQPVKPYLRFKNPVNRIIAMPAYLGGDIDLAGIKWIASYPGNIEKGIQRAHAVTILNDANTGIPVCIINSAKTSAIRTAGVSGVLVNQYLKLRLTKNRKFNVGIVGFGPIGQMHLRMMCELFIDHIDHITISDLRGVDLSGFSEVYQNKIIIAESWEEVYTHTDIFFTCTVATERYISLVPKPGSIHLNVSLRDYYPETMSLMTRIIVDDWDEICRENTDIENMHLRMGLSREDVMSFTDAPLDHMLDKLGELDTVMFNPMGMSVFDIAIASLYYKKTAAARL